MKMPPANQVVPTVAKKQPLKGRGRFVGLVATGKERYAPALIETLNGEIVSFEVLGTLKTDTLNGVTVTGESLPNAALVAQIAFQRNLKDKASDLWAKP